MKMKYFPPEKEERSIATGFATGIFDCSAEEAAAWLSDYCSNERMRMHMEQQETARLELRHKARENEATFATVKKLPFLLDSREFVFRQIWKSEEGTVLVAIESVDDEVDYGVSLRKTRAHSRGIYKLENLPDHGGTKQSRVTFVQRMEPGGSIPTWAVNRRAPSVMKSVQEGIDQFRQDEKIDTADRRDVAILMRKGAEDEVYSEEEVRLHTADPQIL